MITQLPSTTLKKWLLLISVFCFSFNLLVSIVCWVLIGLISLLLKEHRSLLLKQFKNEKYLWILPAFYGLHVLGDNRDWETDRKSTRLNSSHRL